MAKNLNLLIKSGFSVTAMFFIGLGLAFFFGVSGYIVFFFFCVPLTYSILSPTAKQKGYIGENRLLFIGKLLLYATVSYGLFLLLIVFPFFWFPQSSIITNIYLVNILLILCIIPILYYLYSILPRAITNGMLSIPLYPSAYVFIVGYLGTFMWMTTGKVVGDAILETVFIIPIYLIAQLLYIRNFRQMLLSGSASEDTRDPSIHIFLLLVFGSIIFLLTNFFLGIDSVDYPG